MRELFTWEQAQSLIETAVEVADLDFKESAKDLTDIEAAKDIAALANTLGGHIVVGATTTEGRTRCNGLRGIEVVDADKAQRRFEAGAQRIRPAVQIATRQIRVPETSRALVIVQVSAAHAAPVGLQLQEIPGQELVGKGWVFPYRVGSQTGFFSPDQFSAFNAMPSRRAAALLSAIPKDDTVVIQADEVALHPEPPPAGGLTTVVYSVSKDRHAFLFGLLEQVDLLKNVAVFSASHKAKEEFAPLRVPLDWVATVWRDDQQDAWIVVTACRFWRGEKIWLATRD